MHCIEYERCEVPRGPGVDITFRRFMIQDWFVWHTRLAIPMSCMASVVQLMYMNLYNFKIILYGFSFPPDRYTHQLEGKGIENNALPRGKYNE